MLRFSLIYFLFSSLNCFSQERITADAFYRGNWQFSGDKTEAPGFLYDQPMPALVLKTGEQKSFFALQKRAAGYPAPNYFIAEIVGDTIVAEILEGSSFPDKVGEVLKFKFSLQIEEQILTIGFNGKDYVYIREE